MDGMNGVFERTLTGLRLNQGRLELTRPDAEVAVSVTVRYLRPLTGRREIVFLDEHDHEVVTVESMDALTGAERRIVEDALRERYYLAVIERIERIDVQFGTRYWNVDTDRGPRWFALREPGKNVTWLSERHLVLRDTVGNRYEIPDVAALDRRSQRWVDQML